MQSDTVRSPTQPYGTSYSLLNLDLSVVIQCRQSQEPRRAAQFLLNPQQLVVFGDAICARSRPRLDLAGASSYGQVCDECVFCFAGSMRDYRRIPISSCQVDRIERFAHGADLIDLDQNRIRDALVDSLLQELNVGHKQIISHQLDLPTNLFGQILPAIPVV